ncbi:isocitrate lyase/phosphoenolpyruvate mutase family protein [Streptomyces sp. NBC_01012]|uniref:isocitrate lyase/PEP mutase family protein n=1 Tax=Streptomyces sp. NBC_01012 TaxID=2903717 RepID=UPI00386A7F29|nr:isocitrate lyase/phosphoenolpyruvate mutase family protein [Streptomyces sp. NBC_01012]
MNDPASVFRTLHIGRVSGDPLVLPGPWDAASARVFEETGFPALATPSAGVAAALGHADGDTPADEMFAAVARITRAVSVPVSADIEAGYGLAPEELVDRLLEAGAVGCNLEDSVGGVLVEPARQADRLAAVRAAAGERLFVNARIDTYVHGDPAAVDVATDTTARALLYADAGADCVYPIMAPPDTLPALTAAVRVPVNAVCPLGDPSALRRLGELGAARITFGPQFQRKTADAVRDLADGLLGG